MTENRDQTAAVRLTGVTRVYGTGAGRVEALRGVSASFRPGSFTAVMGPSGSGKSTFLQCAAGMDRPTEGSIELAGREIGRLGEGALTRLRRDRVGFVFQGYNLLPALTVAQNVVLPLRLARRRVDRHLVAEMLVRVGLADRRDHLPGQLSGGQQQRVAIARALVVRPAVVFADEPTGALDSRSGQGVLRLLRDVVTAEGMTVIMVSHDPVAAAHADRVLFLADGRIQDVLEAPTASQAAEALAGVDKAGIDRAARELIGAGR